MDLVEMDEDTNMDTFERMPSPEPIDMDSIFGEPQIIPRLGDQYQAKIPSLVSTNDRFQIIEMPKDREVMAETAYSFVIGLPIPIAWIHNHINNVKRETVEFEHSTTAFDRNGIEKSESCQENLVSSKDEDSSFLTVEAIDIALYGTTEKPNLDECTGKSYLPVPSLPRKKSWSDVEMESFLLGLYIFGKNFVQIKKFVENKDMGDILSYYYGQFYRSSEYSRWLECRKLRSRRSIHGHKIFTGWRQQEFLSRLLPHASDKCQNTLEQMSKSFGEGKTSLEEYMSTVKATIGMKAIIEAVAIGKGKQDLTGIMDPVKVNHVLPIRQEIPTGKECNSLTSADIIKFLTGDFRLSKARSNDLFWEAVWPRLLARGWHSEQPKDLCYAASKHSLVFLIPGVKKFSRRRHVKGNHYFDSVSDVLNKVALDPRLIEVEVEAQRGTDGNEEDKWSTQMNLDQNGSSDPQRHCYLRPRTLNSNSDLMKFTIVDTSLAQGDGPHKARELRALPADAMNNSTPSLSKETDEDSSDEMVVDDPDSVNMISNGKGVTNIRPLCTKTSNDLAEISKEEIKTNGPVIVGEPVENHKDQDVNKFTWKQPRRARKCNRRIKPGESNYMAPVTKRRRLTACTKADRSNSMNNSSLVLDLKEENSSCHVDSTDASTNTGFEVETSQEKVPTSSSPEGSPHENCEEIIPGESTLITECSDEKAGPRALIDLNLPHVPQDFETSEAFIMAETSFQDHASEKGSSLPSATDQPQDSQVAGTSNSVSGVEHEPVATNGRRQSTRNRPLTTRALEALEYGFLNAKRRRKGTEEISREKWAPRVSRRARGRADITANLGGIVSDILNPPVDTLVDEECSSNSNTDVVIGYQVYSERKGGNHELVSAAPSTFHTQILAGKEN